MTHVIEDGGEVESEYYNEVKVYDRIILTDGFAVCISKKAINRMCIQRVTSTSSSRTRKNTRTRTGGNND